MRTNVDSILLGSCSIFGLHCKLERNYQCKNFENRLAFGEVRDKSLVFSFFLVHSVVIVITGRQLKSIWQGGTKINRAFLQSLRVHVNKATILRPATSSSGCMATLYVKILWFGAKIQLPQLSYVLLACTIYHADTICNSNRTEINQRNLS